MTFRKTRNTNYSLFGRKDPNRFSDITGIPLSDRIANRMKDIYGRQSSMGVVRDMR